jgi:hypothetical protein
MSFLKDAKARAKAAAHKRADKADKTHEEVMRHRAAAKRLKLDPKSKI